MVSLLLFRIPPGEKNFFKFSTEAYHFMENQPQIRFARKRVPGLQTGPFPFLLLPGHNPPPNCIKWQPFPHTNHEVKHKEYVWAFVVGGAICVVGQLLIDYTKLTPARILVLFVTLGVVLGALGIYEPLVEFAGAGATVPLTGFGYNMAKGTREAIQEQGLLGVFTGGVTAGAAGIAAAVFFGYLAAIFSKPGDKS